MQDDATRSQSAARLATAQNTPVPESPRSSPSENAAVEGTSEQSPEPSLEPSTASFDTDSETLVDQAGDNMQPVYNVTLVENDTAGDVIEEDNGILWGEPENVELACASFTFDVPKQQLQRFLKKPSEHLPCLTVAAKKSRNEVVYSELSKAEKDLFQQAKQKELKCWLDTNTVKAIMRDRIHPSRILASRWILTWQEDMSQPNGRKPKARLVVKGFQDPDIDNLCSDSPTLTRDSRMLLLQTVSSMNWVVQSFDITTAFLRGRSDERELAMEAPIELKSLLGMKDDQVCLLQGNAYGRVDAPLLFYREFRKRLEEIGFVAHPLDNCLFLLRNPNNPKQLDGILGTHVDDGIGGGNQNFEKALEKLQRTLPFGTREYGNFKFTGLDIEQLPDYSIKDLNVTTFNRLLTFLGEDRGSRSDEPVDNVDTTYSARSAVDVWPWFTTTKDGILPQPRSFSTYFSARSGYSAGRRRKLSTWSEKYFIPETHGTFWPPAINCGHEWDMNGYEKFVPLHQVKSRLSMT
eukprot:s1190_g31.t1